MLPYAARAAVSLLHHRLAAFCRSGLLSKVICADAPGGSNAPKTTRMSFIVFCRIPGTRLFAWIF